MILVSLILLKISVFSNLLVHTNRCSCVFICLCIRFGHGMRLNADSSLKKCHTLKGDRTHEGGRPKKIWEEALKDNWDITEELTTDRGTWPLAVLEKTLTLSKSSRASATRLAPCQWHIKSTIAALGHPEVVIGLQDLWGYTMLVKREIQRSIK